MSRTWRGFWQRRGLQRLRQALAAYGPEVEALGGRDKAPREWLELARGALHRAQEAWAERELDAGWLHFKAAQRAALTGWQRVDPAAFRVQCQAVLFEAQNKLGENSWRRRLIVEILADPQKGCLRTDLTPDSAAQALLALQEHQDNLYRRLDLLRGFLLSWNLLAVLAVAAWLSVDHWPDSASYSKAALLGVIGALVSGFARPGATSGQRIPEQIQTISLTFARLSLGALSGIAITVLLGSKLLDLGDMTDQLLPAAAFVAGFSEHLVARAATSIAGRAG